MSEVTPASPSSGSGPVSTSGSSPTTDSSGTRRPRCALQRLRDRAALPDKRAGAGGLHPRPRRSAGVLRRERRTAREDLAARTGSRSSTASSSSRTAGASTTRHRDFAELRAVGRPASSVIRAVRGSCRRSVGRPGRHARVHERHDRPPKGDDDHPRQRHVDDPQLFAVRSARPSASCRSCPQPHRRAHDERPRADRRRRRDVVRSQPGHGGRGPTGLPPDRLLRRASGLGEVPGGGDRQARPRSTASRRLVVDQYLGLGRRIVTRTAPPRARPMWSG